MEILLIVLVLLALGVLGISIKIWAKKNGEFSGTCAGQHAKEGENHVACGLCGQKTEECEKYLKSKN